VLTFDPEAHLYRWNGLSVPNVTRVLAPIVDYSHIAPDVLELARQKGVAVHRMVELDVKGDLDEEGLPDWMRPVLVQWRKFVAETGFRMLRSEYRVFHPTYRYASTLDLFGHVWDDVAFIDIKRSFAAGPAIGVQLAAYQEAYCAQEKVGKHAKRYALRLSEVGPYRLEPFKSATDWQTFLALLTVHRWREANMGGNA
jgi:hypothetical protein